MHRHALRDDQWLKIKDFLPGRECHVGGTAADNRLFVNAVVYRYRTRRAPGGTCPSGLATVSASISATAAGVRVASSRGFSRIWHWTPMPSTCRSIPQAYAPINTAPALKKRQAN